MNRPEVRDVPIGVRKSRASDNVNVAGQRKLIEAQGTAVRAGVGEARSPPVIETLCHDCEARGLRKIETRFAHKVARRQKVLEPLAYLGRAAS